MKKRKILQEIAPWCTRDEILLIVGARQVGKTSLMMLLQKTFFPTNSVFFSLEDFSLLSLFDESPKNLLKLLLEQGKSFSVENPLTVFIDEIQYLSDPSHFLKYLYDTEKGRIRLIVSGSSAFYIDQKFKDSLAGRKKVFRLFPLSFSEFLHFSGQDTLVSNLSNFKFCTEVTQKAIKDAFEEFFLYGGYPKVVLEKNISLKKELLSEILSSYLHKDILEYPFKNPEKLYKLYKILFLQTGNIVNKSELSATLGLSFSILESALGLLQKSFHITLVKPFFKNIRKELTKNPKVFFGDTGLRNSIEGNFASLEDRPDAGSLFETMVLHELEKANKGEIFFWRTQDKKEVDFVLPEASLAIETKLTAPKTLPATLHSLQKEYGFAPLVIDKNSFFPLAGDGFFTERIA